VGRLGPAQIGRRVVVRRILPGRTGPSGGPAFTDVLGVMESWADGVTTIRREDGEVVAIDTALIVAGKPVPPRPSRFSRLAADDVLRRAQGGYRRLASRRVGDWELRYVGGANPLANSVLAAGGPGPDLDTALDAGLDEVRRFYADHERPALAQVVTGSPVEEALLARGWTPVSAPTDVLVAGVAAVARRLSGTSTAGIVHRDALTRAWLVGNDRALANFDVVAATLALPDIVFASVEEDGRQRGRVRANLVDEDWVFVADLWVAPDSRRRGIGRRLMADAARRAPEQGADTLVLHTDAHNSAAQALYASRGFERHHAFSLLAESSAEAAAGATTSALNLTTPQRDPSRARRR
jgi:ribosomal protein S18 acetylase RimI-like enzyme